MRVVKIIKKHLNTVFLDEDSNEISIELSKGASDSDIKSFETKNCKLPTSLKDLLMFSNGLNLFGLNILSLKEMEIFTEENVVSFHSWGNGDFDCIELSSESIFFLYHSVDNLFSVKIYFADWFEKVINEIKENGVLLHPFDYENSNQDGVYRQVWSNNLKKRS